MKKINLLVVVVAFFMFSCGADQASVDKMTGEMCSAMELYKEDDIATMMAAAEKMMEIAGNEAEYGSVTEAQLKGAMEEKCPDGYKKFMELTETAE